MSEHTEGLDVLDQEEDDRPRRRGKGRPGLILLGLLLLLLAVPVGIFLYYGGTAYNAVERIERDPELNLPDYEGRPESAPQRSGAGNSAVNFVLMGSDARSEDYTGRSDTLMVAHVTGDRERVYLLSFPRDLWVDIPGHGKGKINWAYSYGGAALTVETLEQLTGARMDHTTAIDFEGFIRLTDALGGVTVYNPWETTTGGAHFPRGEVTISGEEALAYVRERSQLPNGDLDRAYRQRTVVQAIIRKTLTPQTFTDPDRFSEVVNTFTESLTVDEGLDTGTVTGLATSLRGIDRSEGIRMIQAPITGVGWVGDQSVVVLDQGRMDELARAMQTDTVDQYYERYPDRRYEELPDVELDE